MATGAPALGDAPDLVCRSPLVVIPRFAEVKTALSRLAEVRAVAVLSVHAVEVLVAALLSVGRDVRALAQVRVLAVAGATAEALARHGLLADVVGASGGAALAEAAVEAGVDGPVLVLGARHGRTEFADRLLAAGRAVQRVDAYETHLDEAVLNEAVAEQARAGFAALGVGSPKIAAAWAKAGGSWPPVTGALGETTAEALRALGCPTVVVAARPSLVALLQALRDALDPAAPATELVSAALAASDEIE